MFYYYSMKKNYIPFILTILAIAFAAYCWDKIVLPYNHNNTIYGYYALKTFNPNNEILRYIFFILLPLITFFFSYKILNKNETFSFKKVLIEKNSKKPSYENDYNLFLILFIFILVLEFLSINFNEFSTHLDLFHEGLWLTASNNFYHTNGFWTSSYFARGLFGNFEPLILWNIFNAETIGLSKFSKFILLFINKIALIFLSLEISKNLVFEKKIKISFFIILSLLFISLVQYDGSYDVSEFPTRSLMLLLFFLVFFKSLYNTNIFSISFFLLGLFSVLSLVWYIDIGAYINALLLIILLYFGLRTELKKIASILIGVFSGWLLFYAVIPNDEFIEFINSTSSLYLSMDYIHGLIYPTPFFSGDTRATKALLLILLSGIFVIIFNFNKKVKLSNCNKTFLLFIFIASLLIFKTGLSRSDTPHIKTSSGFTFFLLYFFILYYIMDLKLVQKFIYRIIFQFNKIIKVDFFKFLIIFILLGVLVFNKNILNTKNIFVSFNTINKFIYYDDNRYLTDDYKSLVKYYKEITSEEKCVQIITNETAIPFLLKKPTCTKFYLMWSAGPIKKQKEFIKQLKKNKPKIILYKSDIDPYNDTSKRIPLVFNYINKEYSFYSKFKYWTFLKLN